jgi:DNA polymerase I
MMDESMLHDPMLFGGDPEEGIVALQHLPDESGDTMRIHLRDEGRVSKREEPAPAWLLVADTLLQPEDSWELRELDGNGALNRCLSFPTHEACKLAAKDLAARVGATPSSPRAPMLFISDPVQQYLMASGKTLFAGLGTEQLVRLQIDIECRTAPGYDFCNATREEDAIIAIGLGDNSGWCKTLSLNDMDEKTLLSQFVDLIQERDPDILEGHNLFNFDLPYILARCKRHKVKMRLGRDGSVPKVRTSRLSVAERQISYTRFDIHGRHVIDTLFLVQMYDVSHRSLSGYGLKEVAKHFGVAPADRTYIDGAQIGPLFDSEPERVLAYLRDDISETRAVAELLSRSFIMQGRMLPFSYQNVCVRGNATKIDALMVREYMRRGLAVPMPAEEKRFAGGYTDCLVTGVVSQVHHCDVRSLYPSLMLTRELGPATDSEQVFLAMLSRLRDFRVDAKQAMQQATDPAEAQELDALQTTFKVLINSFYGYLGFRQGHFCDFDSAERVAADGRALLQTMIDWLSAHGAQPIEVDTDGIYFAIPEGGPEVAELERGLAAVLPEGIDVEFDGFFKAMFSYKSKNYALLSSEGELILKGAALKSRGLEPFQRTFMKQLIRNKLEGCEEESVALHATYAEAIATRAWPIAKLSRSEQLNDSPKRYAEKRDAGKTSKRAAYELALTADKEYRAGDRISYYVTGTRKSVVINEAARLASDWDPESRDENIAYYQAKLDALYAKLGPDEPLPATDHPAQLGFNF